MPAAIALSIMVALTPALLSHWVWYAHLSAADIRPWGENISALLAKPGVADLPQLEKPVPVRVSSIVCSIVGKVQELQD